MPVEKAQSSPYDNGMNKLLSFSTRHSGLWLLLIMIITALFATQISKITIDTTTQRLISEDDPDRIQYYETQKIFGSDEVLTIVIEDPKLFSFEKLNLVKSQLIHFQLMPELKRIESLFNTNGFYNDEENTLITTPIFDTIPEDEQKIKELVNIALDNPLFYRTLINGNGNSLAIHLYPDEKLSKKSDFNDNLIRKVEGLIAPFKETMEDVYLVGTPVINTTIKNTMLSDSVITFPMAVIIMAILLYFIYGSLNSSIIPLITGTLSVAWSLGLMGLLDIPIQLLFTAIPVILVVVGSTEDTHIMSGYLDGLEQHKSRSLAIESLSRRLSVPILLTSITTVLGFSTIMLNEVIMLKEFGLITTISLIFNFFITIIIVPMYLKYFGERKRVEKKSSRLSNAFIKKTIDFSLKICTQYRKETIFLVGFIVLASAYLAKDLVADNNPLHSLKDSSPVKINLDKLTQNFSGNDQLFITLTSKNSDESAPFKKSKNLQLMADIESLIKDQGVFDTSRSLSSLVSLINREMNYDSGLGYSIPQNDQLINQYMLFLSYDDKEKYVTSDYKTANIVVWYQISSSDEKLQAVAELEEDIRQILNGTDLEFNITGRSILVANAAQTIIESQIQSLFTILLFVFVIIWLLFADIKLALVSLVPNIVPIFCLFGLMGLFNIPLDFVTCNIAAIAIGIAVDDTLHFFAKFNQSMKNTYNQTKALRETLEIEVRPILSTSVVLTIGMFTLMSSEFVTIIYFGLFTGIVIMLALVADLILTPLFLVAIGVKSADTIFDRLSVRVSDRLKYECQAFKGLDGKEIKKILLRGRIVELKTDRPPSEIKIEDYSILLQGEVNICRRSTRAQDHQSESKFVSIAQIGPSSVIPAMREEIYLEALSPAKVLLIGPAYLQELQIVDPELSTKLEANLELISERGL